VLRLLVRPGEYVPERGAVAAVHGGSPPPARAVRAAIQLGRARTLYQDADFGLRQLADIAIQALSAAINQPTTAVHVIDRIEDLLLRIAASADRTGLFADASGEVRLIEPVPGWEAILDLAFAEISTYGASSIQVTRRLLAAYDTLHAAVPPGRRASLESRRGLLVRQSAGNGIAAADLRADPMGLG
jgi:uncharacterized membrane protein